MKPGLDIFKERWKHGYLLGRGLRRVLPGAGLHPQHGFLFIFIV
jgi:hypothetical protein